MQKGVTLGKIGKLHVELELEDAGLKWGASYRLCHRPSPPRFGYYQSRNNQCTKESGILQHKYFVLSSEFSVLINSINLLRSRMFLHWLGSSYVLIPTPTPNVLQFMPGFTK